MSPTELPVQAGLVFGGNTRFKCPICKRWIVGWIPLTRHTEACTKGEYYPLTIYRKKEVSKENAVN